LNAAFAVLWGFAGAMGNVPYAAAQGSQQRQSTIVTPASPQAVCAFISGKMQSALPQVPTLCSGKQEVSGYYDISIFSPKDVLETDMRRSWSSALFQSFEATVSEKSLNGACSNKETACLVNISDSAMARERTHYLIILDKGSISAVQAEAEAFHGKEFSDPWYLAWWETLMVGKESDHPQSKENAELIAKNACEDYVQASSGALRLRNQPLPSCSVLLATDRAIYIELNFPNTFGALTSDATRYLARTVGRAFNGTGYDGQVIVKSPWEKMTNGSEERVYHTISIRDLEFLADEIESGTRSEAESDFILWSRYQGEGQTIKSALRRPDQKDALIVRNAAVVNVKFRKDDKFSLQTTDGSEWELSQENLNRCGAFPGSEVFINALPGETPSISVRQNRGQCLFSATFLGGW
jgi:hypothetical protein